MGQQAIVGLMQGHVKRTLFKVTQKKSRSQRIQL